MSEKNDNSKLQKELYQEQPPELYQEQHKKQYSQQHKKLHPKLTLQLFTFEKCFGPGVVILLEKIRENSSIRKAAIDMGMSYSKAWTIIKRAEKNLGFRLLESKTGGADGGGATLTQKGERLLCDYRQCESELKSFCEEKFSQHLSWINDDSESDNAQ